MGLLFATLASLQCRHCVQYTHPNNLSILNGKARIDDSSQLC